MRAIYDNQIVSNKDKSINKQIVNSIVIRMRNRIASALARHATISAAQTSTVILAPVALATIAWEVHDSCALLKDLGELESVTDVNTGVSQENQVDDKMCNMSYDDLFEMITGKTLKFDECVRARLITKTINPEECASFETEEILVDTPDINEKIKIVAPNVD